MKQKEGESIGFHPLFISCLRQAVPRSFDPLRHFLSSTSGAAGPSTLCVISCLRQAVPQVLRPFASFLVFDKRCRRSFDPLRHFLSSTSGAASGTRTRTTVSGQGILSPSCLPFHHRGLLFAAAKVQNKNEKPSLNKRKFLLFSFFLQLRITFLVYV